MKKAIVFQIMGIKQKAIKFLEKAKEKMEPNKYECIPKVSSLSSIMAEDQE